MTRSFGTKIPEAQIGDFSFYFFFFQSCYSTASILFFHLLLKTDEDDRTFSGENSLIRAADIG
jgi:hypothetical protein